MYDLSSSQVNDLARLIAGMVEKIMTYYQDPENERAFQEWYLRKYGHPAPDGV